MEDTTSTKVYRVICECVSMHRLVPYQIAGGTEIDVLSRYCWNICLCEALYPSLHNLEIALRNCLYSAIAEISNDADWIINSREAILYSQEIGAVRKTEKELEKFGKPIESSRIVAGLTFGFWTGLFNVRYETDRRLWPQLCKHCFKGMPRSLRTRANISKRFESLRRLRNRVFHHEPVWSIPYLAQLHSEIVETIGWLNPSMMNMTQVVDKFPAVKCQHHYESVKLDLEALISLI